MALEILKTYTFMKKMLRKGSRSSFQPLPGLSGQGEIQMRPAKRPDHFLVTIGQKRIVEYNIRERQVVTNYFTPSHIKVFQRISHTLISDC